MNRIGEINREIKQLMKRFVGGDKNVLHSITKLSREKENLLKSEVTRGRGEYVINHIDIKYTWECELTSGTVWKVQEGDQPNMFHRFMQRICFGIKWSKIDE